MQLLGLVSPGNRVSSRGSETVTMPNVLRTGLTRVHQPPMFFRHGDDPATPPDGLLGAGVLRRRNGSGVAVEHGDRGDGCSRRHGRRVRRPASSLHGPYAELCRSCRLRHGVRPSSLAGLGSCRVRVGITRITIARRNRSREYPSNPNSPHRSSRPETVFRLSPSADSNGSGDDHEDILE